MALNILLGAGATQSLLGRFGRILLIVVFALIVLFGFVILGWAGLWMLRVFLGVPIPIDDPLTPVNWLATLVTSAIRLTPVVVVLGFAEAGVGIIYTITYIAAGMAVLAALLTLFGAVLLRNNPDMAESLFGISRDMFGIVGNLLDRGSTIAGNLTDQAYSYVQLQQQQEISPPTTPPPPAPGDTD